MLRFKIRKLELTQSHSNSDSKDATATATGSSRVKKLSLGKFSSGLLKGVVIQTVFKLPSAYKCLAIIAKSKYIPEYSENQAFYALGATLFIVPFVNVLVPAFYVIKLSPNLPNRIQRYFQ